MSVRVAAGEFRGRRLVTPGGIRPTQGLVKEAIFSMLGERVLAAVAVDLYAGSGSLGIEALSRGAETAVFVERTAAGAAAIRANLETLGVGERARVVQADVRRHLGTAALDEWDLVLLDPPYGSPDLAPVLEALAARLPARATVVVEHGRADVLPEPAGLEAVRVRRYGDSSVTILTRR